MENQILWKGSEVKKLKMSLSMDEIEILKALFTEYQSLHKEMNLTFQKCGLSDQEIEAYRCLQDKELIHDFRAVESDGRIFYTGVMSAEAARVIPHLLELQNVPDKIRRYDILQLIRCGKPMIVFGYYQTPLHVKETGYATFIHVCPWAWKASTRPITQHITISREHIEQYIHLDMTDDGKAYFLIVKPYQFPHKK